MPRVTSEFRSRSRPERSSPGCPGSGVLRRPVPPRHRRSSPLHPFSTSVTNLHFGGALMLVINCGCAPASWQVRRPVGRLEGSSPLRHIAHVIFGTRRLHLRFSSLFVVAKGDRAVRLTAVGNTVAFRGHRRSRSV